MTPRLIVAAPHSGAGKTTVTAAILAGLRAHGLRVQPFKAGPDYLDPTHLGAAAGVAARNLDSFLLPPGTLEALFVRAARGADVSIIEGVMGLFDGRDPLSDDASTADLARRLGVPVVLVLDVRGAARSAAAMALGFARFAPDLNIAGVILNRVGSERHARLCEAALAQVGVRSFGFLPRDERVGVPERHMGLVLAGEARIDHAALTHAAQQLDLPGLLEVARSSPPLPDPPALLPRTPRPARACIALARDEAFNFYYPDALDVLRDLGAELIEFSPLRDGCVPDAGALLIGGGYPELHAAPLSANTAMRASVRSFAASGRPVIAECGGLMYLGETLRDLGGRSHRMCGVIPARTVMRQRPILGYREVVTRSQTPYGPAGTGLRGHEFHFSELETPLQPPAYGRVGGGETEGYAAGNVLASYVHLHLAAHPEAAEHFVELAARWTGRTQEAQGTPEASP
ncbi:cobyrinate a,c-diamide synthase [Deinococcus peraridilitoris]|uniref:Cobyrinate a,c-diamide synthase n=1 Tax=Deinococcus peraridilitoris (strain DSM 19664 / LMG 22246 / CIP 109416 / KR-200) TaxID=937777 RepID=L0A1S5_DEIPD|nr:cobyrinate a,c-diamide synthase [Deinococcus peraridilitoris]AFZ67796.1 cobyrinic acid a,c-diamide synthase [Deinococcus peraridilitoris DSM 19664]